MILLFALLFLAATPGPDLMGAIPGRDPTIQLRYEIGSLQSELLETKARIENQEIIIDALRREMECALSTSKELVKGTVSSSEGKLSSFQKASTDLASDLIKLKEGTEAALKELDHHLTELEKKIETQGKNVKHLEVALKAMIEATLGDKGEAIALATDKSYTVKEGDSLGKIAHVYGTNVKTLKELNNLTKDTIRVGQKIYLP